MIELITRAYDAFNRRDTEAVLELMHPEVVWPNVMEGGLIHGRDGVRTYWMHQWQVVDPHVSPVTLRSLPDGRVLVWVRQVVKDLEGALLFDRIIGHIYTVHDGLITKMEIEEATEAAESGRSAS